MNEPLQSSIGGNSQFVAECDRSAALLKGLLKLNSVQVSYQTRLIHNYLHS